MDQIKIGKFIAEMRKEQNLTQIDLADALGISNKTISKWECGNGMPDYSVMEDLCDVLKININELLSGERLPSKDYNKKAEENMMNLMHESVEKKKRERNNLISCIVGIVGLLFTVWWMIIAVGGVGASGFFVDIPTVVIVGLAPLIILLMTGQWKSFWKSYLLMWRQNKNVQQIKKSMLAVKTVVVSVLISGMLKTIIDFFVVIRVSSGEEWDFFSIHLAISLLPMFYGLFYSLCLLPIYMRLKSKLIEE